MPKYPKIKSRIIKYDSPSGYVHIGKYIPPFEKVKDGYGFMGVVLEDKKSGKIQCNICGKWFEQLQTHLVSHNMSSEEYKLKYGLLMSTALKSKRLRLIHSQVMIDLRKKNKANRYKFRKNNEQAGNRKNKPKAIETVNKYGVCDLQIRDRILQLKEKLGKTPSLIDIQKEYGGGFIFHIHKRYASYIKLCRDLDIQPLYSNHNPKYSRQYFIEKALSNEPSIRIFTTNESRALYKYFKGGIKELKQIIEKLKTENGRS